MLCNYLSLWLWNLFEDVERLWSNQVTCSKGLGIERKGKLMKKGKKILAAMMIMALAFAVVGCGKKDDDKNNQDSSW